jgi:hypothetical protein
MVADGSDAEASASRDQEALELRLTGRAFSSIATALGMERSSEANLAFNRALRRQPTPAQDKIRADENLRLDRMAMAVRTNGSLSEAEGVKRLRAIDLLRGRLMAD